MIDLGASVERASVRVSDVLGRQIQTQEFTQGQQFTFEITAPAGLYFLTIETPKNKTVVKITKE